MNPTSRRAMTAVLATVLVLGPMAGAARADDAPADVRTWGLSLELQQRNDLVTAIDLARTDLRRSVQSARTALRTTVDGIRLQVLGETTAQRTANRAGHERDLSMAVAAARSSLQTARSIYSNRLNAAFSTWAPNATIPRTLIDTTAWSGIGDGAWLDLDRLRSTLPRS